MTYLPNPKPTACFRVISALFLALSAAASAAVVDISNAIGPTQDGGLHIDNIVGAGNSGRLTGHATTFWNSNGFTVPIDLNGNTLEVNSGGGNEPFRAHGAISGSGTLIFDTVLAHKITVDAANAYSGATLIRRGWVQMGSTANQNNLLGTITVGQSSAGKLAWDADNQVSDSSDISLAVSGSSLVLNGFSEEIRDLHLLSGTSVDTGAGSVLKVANLYIDGVLQPEIAVTPGDGFVTGSGYIEVGASGPPVIADPPAAPSSPAPADLAADVHPATFSGLDWADSAGATGYDVYFWPATETKPASPTASVALSNYSPPGGLVSLTNYRWQIVAKNPAGQTAGPGWTFSTLARWDVSGVIENPTQWVGAGNTANLVGDTSFTWQTGNCAIPAKLNGFTLTFDSGGGNPYNYTGTILSGTGGLILKMARHDSGYWNVPMRIGGAAGNNYSGPTLAAFGTISLEKSSGNALAGPIVVGQSDSTARLVWMANDQLSDSSAVTMTWFDVTAAGYPAQRGTFLNLNGHSDTIASLSLAAGNLVKTGDGGVLTTGSLSIDGTLMGSGSYTSATHDFVTGTGAVVVLNGGGTGFQIWAGSHGLTGADADFAADPDGDGISNGIEFVIGGEPNPAAPDTDSNAGLPLATRAGGDFVFTFTRTHSSAYLNPFVEFSSDLQSPWITATDPENAGISITPDTAVDVISVAIPYGMNPRLFARLRVEAAEPAGAVSPRITASPADASAIGGGDITLTAAAGGAKTVAWQWYRNGVAIPGAVESSYIITAATSADAGDYHAVVTNEFGNAVSAAAHVAVSTPPGISGLALIPWPLDLQPGVGNLIIPNGARIVATDPSLLDAAQVLSSEIQAAFAITLPVAGSAPIDGDIVLSLDAALTGERHTVEAAARATVRGENAFAVSLGTATLLQALRPEAGGISCPRFSADDSPTAAIRAFAIDLARQNHSLESLFQAVDLCRLYKINYLHLHFNDDQAYTFPSAAYPLLNTVTASRGGVVYTVAQMQQLEAYAVARGVHIMPEWEGPGHNALMLAAYPDLFKITYPFDPDSTDPAYPKYPPSSSINVAKPEVRAAVRTLIGEMCAVFQSTPYIHLGCDEVDWAWSEHSLDFQNAFAEWGFHRSNPRENVGLVFSKFIGIARDYAAEFGKQTIIWENGAVLGSPEVPSPTDVLVMPFDSYNPGVFPAHGMKLVNAAWSPLYLVNHLRKPVSSIYRWNPGIFGQYSGECDEYVSHTVAAEEVLGTQLTSFEQTEDMEMRSARLRLAAMSERTWNPGLDADYANFRNRLTSTDSLLDAILSPVKINYAGLDDEDDLVFSNQATVTMSLTPGAIGQGLTIRYTANGTDVTKTSALYPGPFQVTSSGAIRAAAFNGAGQRIGRMARELHRHELTLVDNPAAGKPVTATSGANASKAVDLRDCQGWNTNVSAARPAGESLTVDLQETRELDRVTILFAPEGTSYYRVDLSTDGEAWQTVADRSSSGVAGTRAGINHSFGAVSARFVRLTLLPHAGGNGDKSVLEIMVREHQGG